MSNFYRHIWKDDDDLFESVFHSPTDLYDEMKQKLLKAAYEKYELEDLMKKLDIKYNEF